MGCKLILGVLVMSTVWSFVVLNKTEVLEEFNCCYPLEIQINRNHDHEISRHGESLVTASESTFDTKKPFTAHGNNTVILDKCLDFDYRIVFTDEYGKNKDKQIHYHGQPCNSTAPDNGPVGNNSVGTGVGVGVGVLILAGVIVAIVYCKRKANNNNNNNHDAII